MVTSSLISLNRDIGVDSQGEDYHYPFTLPSQSQLEDNFKSKLTIHEGIEETRAAATAASATPRAS